MNNLSAAERDRIEVGKPLPFSVFTAEGKLLLAAGQVVASERLRELLLKTGQSRALIDTGLMADPLSSTRTSRQAREEAQQENDAANPEAVLESLRRDYDAAKAGYHLAIAMARNETDKPFTVQLLGVHNQMIIVTAPVHPNGSLVPVLPGQTWSCRTFQMTSAFRFTTMVAKAAFEPYPHLHLQLQKQVEQLKVRGQPRAKVSVKGELRTPQPTPCVIVDLSASGARVALDGRETLESGREINLVMTVEVLQQKYDLALNGTVVSALGPSDARHPAAAFYGLKFSEPGETDALVLHGFVSSHLLAEFHSLWQMLSMAATALPAR